MKRQQKPAPDSARIIDVNLNRLTEGLRVIEDIIRFQLESKSLLSQVRSIRIKLGSKLLPLRREVLEFRASERDLGKTDHFDRLRRRSLEEVLMANFKRSQEAARVLEEIFKVERAKGRGKPPINFKQLRFRLYRLEKKVIQQLQKGIDLAE